MLKSNLERQFRYYITILRDMRLYSPIRVIFIDILSPLSAEMEPRIEIFMLKLVCMLRKFRVVWTLRVRITFGYYYIFV